MEDYLKKVKEQLCCNSTAESVNYITYDYTNEQVYDHFDYFERCKKTGLSPYKALLFFGDYMDGNYNI